jgi:hypothetical protein
MFIMVLHLRKGEPKNKRQGGRKDISTAKSWERKNARNGEELYISDLRVWR